MRCISIWQPFASLLMSGIKGYETRHWSPPQGFVGKRVAIHAAKTMEGMDDFGAPHAQLPDVLQLQWQASMELKRSFPALADYPLGVILGTAVLQFVVRTDGPTGDVVLPQEKALGNWMPKRYAWRFTDHHVLPAPVPYRGQQGWFVVPDEVAA